MKTVSILGVPVHAITEREALMHIGSFCKAEGKFHIATPNPEMLVEAQKNNEFKEILQHTALNLPDGTGLLWAAKRAGVELPERVTGTDIVQKICSPDSRLCPPERVFLLGAAEGIAERAMRELQKHHRRLPVVGTYAGSPKTEDEEKILEMINTTMPTILFVAFGAPQQDVWIARNLPKMKTVKVAMGVGGAFDFIAGKQKRAPKWMRDRGIEWLWRLIRQPNRIVRIWNAVVVFPFLVRRSQ